MLPPPGTVAHAKASCQRCHRRKKKCDRSLPQCRNCEQAKITCSFLGDHNQVGSYSIAYVKGLQEEICNLECKIQELEQKLFEHETSQLCHDQIVEPALSDMDMQTLPLSLDMHPTPIDFPDYSPIDVRQEEPPAALSEPPSSLARELKELSLQAAAERHLGNSSGIDFARLTQLVLSRLSPDKADFVFEVSPLPYRALSSPFALESVFDELNAALPSYPTTMFTGFRLSDIAESATALTGMKLPDEPHLSDLVDFYFAHSHTLYPIIDRKEFMLTFDRYKRDPSNPWAASPLSLFRIWIVLAIGATTYCSVTLNEESEPMSYFNKAMLYFEASLDCEALAALEVLLLQVSYSFFNQLGPNTWFLVGVAARMAVGLGLHSCSAYKDVPPQVAERQKQLFFSVYMMDRVVSMALGRPSAINDDDIEISPFAAGDENTNPGDESRLQNPFQPSTLVIPLHILALRKIAGKISKTVYCSNIAKHKSPQERKAVTQDLHKELIDWRRNMPFPLPDKHPRVPQMSTSWYDFNFYIHLTLLYRPSPLSPILDEGSVVLLADAASMAIRQALNMHRQQRFAYNWLNLLSVFTVTLALVYATTASPDNLTAVLRRSKAIPDLEAAMEMFEVMSVKFPAAKNIGGMIQQIVTRYKDISNAMQ